MDWARRLHPIRRAFPLDARNAKNGLGNDMSIEHIKILKICRAKLLDNRRAISKRDSISERNEGFAERIVSIQAAIEATDRAIAEEEAALPPSADPTSID